MGGRSSQKLMPRRGTLIPLRRAAVGSPTLDAGTQSTRRQPTLSQMPDLHSPRLVHYLRDILAHRHRALAARYKLVRHNGPPHVERFREIGRLKKVNRNESA